MRRFFSGAVVRVVRGVRVASPGLDNIAICYTIMSSLLDDCVSCVYISIPSAFMVLPHIVARHSPLLPWLDVVLFAVMV